MNIDIALVEEGISRVNLVGSLDVSGAQAIERDLSAAVRVKQQLIIDLSQVKFLSSQGIRALVVNAKAVAAKGHKLVLSGPPPQVAQVLRVSGIDKVIPVYDQFDAALAAVKTPAVD